MTQQTINIGSSANDRSGDPLRTAFNKINANFTDLYSQVSAETAIPSQTGNNGKYLTTNGSALSWGSVSSSYTLPPATTSTLGGVIVDGNTITISPTTNQISAVSQIPIQTGHSGSVLTTNGTSTSWSALSTNSLTNNGYTLELGSDGTLNLPLSTNGQGVIQTTGSYYLDANGAVYNLGSNGTFTIPTGGVITDSNSYLTTLNLFVQGSLKGVDGSIGSTGQVLTRQSNGGAAWATPSSGSSSTLVNGSYTLSLASNGVVNVPTSQYNTAQVFASTTNTTMCLGNSSHFIQVRGSDGALVFADYSVQTTAYLGTATTSQIGGVQPDGTSITISNGVISSANSFQPNGVFTITTAGGTTALTSSTAINITLTGSNTQTIQLPDATTLKNGWIYRINNNSSNASSMTVNNASGSQIGTVPQGGDTQFILLDNSTTNGIWDNHGWIPGNLLMSSSTFQLGSSAYTIAPYNSSLTIGTATGGTTYNFATGATTSGNTKTVNIGTGGVSGSTTAITVGSSGGTSTTAFNGVTTFNAAVKFNGALQSGGGATNITLSNNGPTMNGITTMGIVATAQTAGTIASASTIAPTNPITFVSGTTQITTITAPSGITTYGGQITLIPTGLWTTATSGNIALATTAVVSKALIMTYDAGTSKWYPSY